MAVHIVGLQKSFAVPVLKNINLSIEPGKIHGLVGENGAGKSTLINILMGLVHPDQGQIFIDGRPYHPKSVNAAKAEGLSLAAQELSVIDNLSVAENIQLKHLPQHFGVIDRQTLAQECHAQLVLVGLHCVAPEAHVGQLSLAQKQLVELAKALFCARRLLILDEPTAALTESQAEHLHTILRARVAEGMSVIYVSHRLHDVLSVCDNISVLRDGELKITAPSNEFTVDSLISAMSGTQIDFIHSAKTRSNTECCLQVDSITTQDLPYPISFECARGEILGIAGLAGAGRTELLEAIYGLQGLKTGSVSVCRDQQIFCIRSVSDATRHGMGMVAEDRKSQGIFADKSVAMNISIAHLRSVANWMGILDSRKEMRSTDQLIERLSVKCNNAWQPIASLSGGNQQKLLIGRWMHAGAQLLLLDEPTRGVDPNAKQIIHRELHQLSNAGVTLIIVSSELSELTSLCDRILVLSERKLAAQFIRGSWTQDELLQAAFSEHTSVRQTVMNGQAYV